MHQSFDSGIKESAPKRQSYYASLYWVKFTLAIYITVYAASFFGLLQILVVIAILLLAIVLAIFYIYQQRYWKSLASLFAPISALLLSIGMTSVGLPPEKFEFWFTSQRYYSELDKTSFAPDEAYLKVWFWRDDSPLFGSIEKFLVYDETDQITFPILQRSPNWVASAKKNFLWADFEILIKGLSAEHNGWDGEGIYKVETMGQHFYFVTIYVGV